jgi:hypothetical protein
MPDVPEGIYLQYRAVLITTVDRMVTPKLNALSIGYKAAPTLIHGENSDH